MAKSGSTYYVTLHTISDIVAYLKDKDKMKTLPPFVLPPPPIISPVTDEDAPQTPEQASASLGTSPVTETANNSATVTKEVNNGVAIARNIAEEGGFSVDDVFHEGEDIIHHRVETIRNALM
eukprot:3649650-Ditylum_brightwellii.AAC.1